MVRPLIFLGITVLLAWLFWIGVKPGWNEVNSDFSNYYTSAQLVYRGEPIDSLYQNAWFKEKGRMAGADATEKFTPFPPITAFLALPVAWMSPLNAQRTLLIINIVLCFLCVRLIKTISGWELSVCLLFVLVSGWAIANNFRLGQFYIVILWFSLLSHVWATEKKERLAGISIGFISVLKYFTVIYIPAYWLAGKRKLVVAALLAVLLLMLLQFLFFGTGVMNDFFHTLVPHLDGRIGGQGIFHYHFQSWESLLSFLFVVDPEYNPQPWLNMPAAKTWIKYSIILLVLAGTAVGIKRIRSFPEPWKLNGYVGLIGVSAFALLPASATYHFVMLIFPVLLLVLIPNLNSKLRWIILFLYTCIGLIPYGFFEYLGNNWGVFFGFPRLWATTLLFVATLAAILKLEHNR